MVGGRDFEQSQFNRAVQAIRQPGSAFKPIIYGAALDRGFTPASILIDSPVSYGDSSLQGRWTPANYDNRFWGPILLRDALIYSRNVVTVKLLQSIGPRQAIEYAKQLGIHSPLTPTLALALGASAVSLWELLTAYSTFANQGARTDPYLIEKVLDRYGRVLTAHQPQPERVISPESAFVMTDILKGVIEEGTGRRARKLGTPAAGKTGTSNDLKDAWFIGYTPSILTGVWVGYDDDDITLGGDETGGHAACPIWLYFMEEYLRDQPIEKFPVPEDIVFARVSARGSGSEQETTGKAVYAAFRKDQLRGDPNTLQNQAASDESGELRSPRGVKQEDPMDAFFKSDIF
jgi:penicillin-binding protein 1A